MKREPWTESIQRFLDLNGLDRINHTVAVVVELAFDIRVHDLLPAP